MRRNGSVFACSLAANQARSSEPPSDSRGGKSRAHAARQLSHPGGRAHGERPSPKDRLCAPETYGYGGDMQVFPQNTSTIWYMALVVLLAAGLAIGIALFALQARGPVGAAEFVVETGSAVDCPAGSGAPVCYRFDVTNAGAGAGELECLVMPIGGGKAVFTASGSEVYRSEGPVTVGDTYPLYTEVRASGGETEVGRPDVACRGAE